MLMHLHVKNLALIREAEIDFTEGLNILTGETGAGKSIVIGSVALALGGKSSRELLRPGADYGLVELVFQVSEKKQQESLRGMDIFPEEDTVIISRRLMDGRSVNKINGETVTLSTLRAAAELLIDIHGQQEHQTLLRPGKHLEILDEYAKEELSLVKQELARYWKEWKTLSAELAQAQMDEESRLREVSLLEFETGEIEEASLIPGEDEELEQRYRRMTNARRLLEAAGLAYGMTGYEEENGAGTVVGRALRELQSVSGYDEDLRGLSEQLGEVDALLNDFNRDLAEYLSSLNFAEEEFQETEERLNLLNHLKAKYGKTLEEVLAYQERQQERLDKLKDYDSYLENLRERLKTAEQKLVRQCEEASRIRQEHAERLCREIRGHLVDLNFLEVQFSMEFSRTASYTAGGWDEAEFQISTNPGEPLRPLAKVASGGELSRIMLAIRTVLADRDDIETVIFDEIDTGISGRTAQKVSEKMMEIGRSRQVICITHLAQIAAMADSHFRIEKAVEEGETRTRIRRLTEQESIQELARILSGAEMTETVLDSAAEMRRLAQAKKA